MSALERCAKAWSSSVQMISAQSQRRFLRELLAGKPLTYDDAHFYFSCVDLKGPEESFDLLIRMAHAISVDTSLSLTDVTALTMLMANFTVEFIAFNISEVTENANSSEAVIAAEQAYQMVPLPSLSHPA
jgi:hypothetical protein